MGVHGATSFLKQRGLLPPPTSVCCSASLWADPPGDLKAVPPGSTFLADGNGLAFHLHSVAYARHARDVVGNRDAHKKCPTIRSLAARADAQERLTRLLPVMMPLSLLREVTEEFVKAVRGCGVKIDLYWDGPAQRFKGLTSKKRADRRANEWGAVEQWCIHGTLPLSESETACECEYNFPYSALFIQEIRQVLRNLARNDGDINMVQCQEEADVELARKAAGLEDHFILGQDSDFVFYKDVKYLPIDSLALRKHMPSPVESGKLDQFSKGVVSASEYASVPSAKKKTQSVETPASDMSLMGYILTRAEVASVFDVPDSLMPELAILLGNDYVDSSKTSIKKQAHSVEEVVEYLHDVAGITGNGDGDGGGLDFRTASEPPNSSVERAMEFVRVLYDLKSMDDFPIEDHDLTSGDDTESESDDESSFKDLAHILEGQLTEISSSFTKSHFQLKGSDKFASDVVVRGLQAVAKQPGGQPFLTQTHIDAYVKSIASNNLISEHFTPPLRPKWEDILAGYAIEVCVLRLYRYCSQSSLARNSLPDALTNQFAFHSVLASGPSGTSAKEAALDSPAKSQQATSHSGPAHVRVTLPIDEYEDEILNSIEMNRVTIIHGETGCGKSSRLPAMLLRAPPPDISLSEVKMYISQPRRIAAKALVERVRSCEPDLKDTFALRMGHGWREYESNETRCWFVTTGYLTRVLANNPARFNRISHLVVDEVHERSVDTDILCLLCRRLLDTNKHIRLVLMSATLATSLYTEYFKVPNPAIHVGARRYPIKEYFIEDLQQFGLPPKEAKAASAIIQECEKFKCRKAPSSAGITHRCQLAARLATIVGKPGSSVLIFVPGMAEILATMEFIEGICIIGARFTCFPIHSDIAFEDQMAAFDSPRPTEVKIIIATNAAESSVTLPDVDDVICFGLCKQIVYNEKSHRQMLTSAWISRASSTQRAGRTGRVRPGRVYRLYTRTAFTVNMAEFEPGEMVRIPLDSVILMMKEMLNEEITPLLLDCLEPPNLSTIDKSFQSLKKWGFLSEASDYGDITTMGKFVSSLGIDLMLGALIGLGIQFGVAAESIEMAAVMGQPQSPYRRTSPAMTTAETNEVLSSTFIARCHFDANLKSETFGLMNFLWDFTRSSKKAYFARYFSTAFSRVKQLAAVRDNLRRRVATFLGVNEFRLEMEAPPVLMPPAKIELLRIIQVWVFGDMMICCKPSRNVISPDGSVSFGIRCREDGLTKTHFDEILDKRRHPFEFRTTSNIQQSGSFVQDDPFQIEEFAALFEPRAISYCLEQDITAFWYYDNSDLVCIMPYEVAQAIDLAMVVQGMTSIAVEGDFVFYEKRNDTARRGINERKCGFWTPMHPSKTSSGKVRKLVRLKVAGFKKEYPKRHLEKDLVPFDQIKALMHWRLSPSKASKGGEHSISFFIRLFGSVSNIEGVDMKDLLGGSITYKLGQGKSIGDQKLWFPPVPESPMLIKLPNTNQMASTVTSKESSWKRPLFDDIPEGARLVSLVASKNRQGGPMLKLSPLDQNLERITVHDVDDGDEIDPVCVSMQKAEVQTAFRWKRVDSGQQVFTPDVAVPSTAVHSSSSLFCCCSNSLELSGGKAKVEGLTLLPPEPLFVLLSFLSFGLKPGNLSSNIEEIDKAFDCLSIDSDSDPGTVMDGGSNGQETHNIAHLLKWIRKYDKVAQPMDDDGSYSSRQAEATGRIYAAIGFHESCADMGETLCCFPDKVTELCDLFDGVGGISTPVWDSLESKSLTPTNLRKWRYEHQTTRGTSAREIEDSVGTEPKRKIPVKTSLKSAHEPKLSVPRDEFASKRAVQIKQAPKAPNPWGLNFQPQPRKENVGGLGHGLELIPGEDAIQAKMGTREKVDSTTITQEEESPKFNGEAILNAIGPDVELIQSKAGVGPPPNKQAKKKRKKNMKKDASPEMNESKAPKEVKESPVGNSCAPNIEKGNNQDKESNKNKEVANKDATKKFRWVIYTMEITPELCEELAWLFITNLPKGKKALPTDLYSTNIMAMLFVKIHDMMVRTGESVAKRKASIALDRKDWTILHTIDSIGKRWFSAKFQNDSIPDRNREKREESHPALPAWFPKQRPSRTKVMRATLPPRCKVPKVISVPEKKGTPTLFFSDPETAVKMEAVFWLDRTFTTIHQGKVRRWYKMSIPDMMADLQSRVCASQG